MSTQLLQSNVVQGRRLNSGWWAEEIALGLAYVGAYIALDWLSFIQPVLKLGITPWNPQTSLTIAFLLLRSPRSAPWTAIAAFGSEILIHATPVSPYLLAATSVLIAVTYGALASALRRLGFPRPVAELGAAVRLIGPSALATLVIAALYVAILVGAKALPADAAPGAIARYWIGDLNGVLTVVPLLIPLLNWRAALAAIAQRRWEILAQAATLALVLWTLFKVPATNELRMFYPLFAPVLWVALRWQVAGGLIAVLSIQLGLIGLVQVDNTAPPLLDLQCLMVTLCLAAIFLGAAVSERAEAVRRAAGREAEQRTLLATAPDAVLLLDLDRRILSANHAAERLFGDGVANQLIELATLLPAIELAPDDGRVTINGRNAHDESFPAEVSWARVEPPASPGYLVIVRDATERTRAESRLRERDAALARAMRFTMAGELASALAHELNQPITALVSYLQSAEILSEPLGSREPRLHATLTKSKQEALRAADVLKRLRDFYRGSIGTRELVNIGALCTRVAETFHDRLRSNRALLELKLATDLPVVRTDPMHLEIALHNLLGNAIDAVSSEVQAQRRIRMSADCNGPLLTVGVEDSGPGVSPQSRRTLFEPFETSKPDGMGLGLAISRSLLRAQGGELSLVDGSILGGACFLIHLPLKPADALP